MGAERKGGGTALTQDRRSKHNSSKDVKPEDFTEIANKRIGGRSIK